MSFLTPQIIQTNPQWYRLVMYRFLAKQHTKKRPTTRWERLEFDSLHASPLQQPQGNFGLGKVFFWRLNAEELGPPKWGKGPSSANQWLHIWAEIIPIQNQIECWLSLDFSFHFSLDLPLDKQTRSSPLILRHFLLFSTKTKKTTFMAPKQTNPPFFHDKIWKVSTKHPKNSHVEQHRTYNIRPSKQRFLLGNHSK